MPSNDTVPYYSGEELSTLALSAEEMIQSIEAVIRSIHKQSAWCAPKATLLPDDGRYMMATLAASDDTELLAVKTLVLNPRNSGQGLPQINGLVTLLNSQTGLPKALLDGSWITAIRTAALSATAAKYMANTHSASIAFLGCGVQALSHLTLLTELFPIKQISLYGRGKHNIDKMSEAGKTLGLSVSIHDNAKEALQEADLVVSSITYSATQTPFVNANWLKQGAFAMITDLAGPWQKDSFNTLNTIAIDDLEQETSVPNKLLRRTDIDGDLSNLVLNQLTGRARPIDRNAFVFRGHAIGDLAISVLAYQKAQATRNR